MDWIKGLLDINKIPTRIIILIWIISALILFIPNDLLNQLSLKEFKISFGKYIGIIFISSLAFIIIIFITWVSNRISNQRLEIKYKKIIKDSVNSLDMHERAVLREYYIQGQNTLKIPLDNPTVSGLINKRILYQVGQYGKMSLVGMLFNFSITEIARELLTPEILELPVSEPTEKELNKLRNERPKWMLKIESDKRLFEGIY